MSPVNLDFSGVEGGDFPIMDAGDYPATIFEIKQNPPGPSGYPFLSFTFKLKDSDRRLWRNYSLSPKALWALKTLLQRLGWSEEELGGEFNFDEKELLGKAVILRVSMNPNGYQNKPQNEVDDVMADDGSGSGWG